MLTLPVSSCNSIEQQYKKSATPKPSTTYAHPPPHKVE